MKKISKLLLGVILSVGALDLGLHASAGGPPTPPPVPVGGPPAIPAGLKPPAAPVSKKGGGKKGSVGGGGDLLAAIRGGATLKPTETVDKSGVPGAGVVKDDSSSSSSSSSSDAALTGNRGGGSSSTRNAAPNLANQIAGARNKLKSANRRTKKSDSQDPVALASPNSQGSSGSGSSDGKPKIGDGGASNKPVALKVTKPAASSIENFIREEIADLNAKGVTDQAAIIENLEIKGRSQENVRWVLENPVTTAGNKPQRRAGAGNNSNPTGSDISPANKADIKKMFRNGESIDDVVESYKALDKRQNSKSNVTTANVQALKAVYDAEEASKAAKAVKKAATSASASSNSAVSNTSATVATLVATPVATSVVAAKNSLKKPAAAAAQAAAGQAARNAKKASAAPQVPAAVAAPATAVTASPAPAPAPSVPAAVAPAPAPASNRSAASLAASLGSRITATNSGIALDKAERELNTLLSNLQALQAQAAAV